MIGRLCGKLSAKKPPLLLLDVQGVGYEVEASMNTFYRLPDVGEQATLHIHMVVREDAQLLFGFIDETERQLFRRLIKVGGVGPKLALAILSAVNHDEFVHCIRERDVKRLTHIPGVGKKTAERLCVEMRDDLQMQRTGESPGLGAVAALPPARQAERDAVDALIALGYKAGEAERAVREVMQNQQADQTLSAEQLIRRSLKSM